MKKTVSRFLSLLLSILMLLSIVACSEATDTPQQTLPDAADTSAATEGQTSSESEGEETKAPPTVASNQYNEDFVTLYCSDIFRKGYYFVEDDERTPGNDLEDHIFERTLAVEEHLGVDVIAVDGGTYTEYGATVSNSITAGDDAYQLVLTHVYYGVSNFITSNLVRPFNEFGSINLDAYYWNSTLMDSLAINDQMYFGYGDFCLSNCYVIAFNKDMVKEYENVVGDIYQQVLNHTWTLDKLIEYTSLVSQDNGDGVWDVEDTYGFAGYAWVPLISFQTACDIPIVQEDADGELYISPLVDNAEKIVDLDQKIFDFVNSNNTYMWAPPGLTGPTEALPITSDRVMFQMLNNFELVTTTATDVKIGVLPYPKWDEEQEDYKTLNWNGLMCVPTSAKNTKMVGDVIEMLGYYSDDVTTAFYETLLGTKVANAPQDSEMLDIIWASQVSDIGLAFSAVSSSMDGILYAIPHHTTANAPAYATYVKSKVRSAERSFSDLYNTAE